jgi:hypothetical protein
MAPGEVRVVVRTCRIVVDVDIGTSFPAMAAGRRFMPPPGPARMKPS